MSYQIMIAAFLKAMPIRLNGSDGLFKPSSELMNFTWLLTWMACTPVTAPFLTTILAKVKLDALPARLLKFNLPSLRRQHVQEL
jgi:hypothetical protein